MKRLIGILASFLLLIGLNSCEDLFQYSPYDADVSETNLNARNIDKIAPHNPSDTLWFVALADVHAWYDELYDATLKINQLKNISFVVVCGDITDEGLAKEFEWYNRVMENLKVPYLTIIGNHDYRSNGSVIYKKMFGPTNFTFNIGAYHFIGFDDVVWENNNTMPDFNWLNSNVLDTTSVVEVVFAHIPPWTDQLDLDTTEINALLTKKPNHVLSVHGHLHGYSYNYIQVHHIITGCVKDREISLIGLHDTTFTFQRIKF
ncbi:MAG: metallophosphoesterase [Chloroflexia bacterium]|nr:metallophosphoesterase [Chloroflexia bacterium]